MRLAAALTTCAVAGCATYKPGSFAGQRFPGERLTVGCLDLAVDRRVDVEGAPVLEYQFGNRCDRPVTIDLANVPVVGRMIDGTESSLVAFDPELEIVAVRLDGRRAGREALAYPAAMPVAQVCVDAARIGGERAAPRWLCFGDPAVIAAARRSPAAEAIQDGQRTRISDGDAGGSELAREVAP